MIVLVVVVVTCSRKTRRLNYEYQHCQAVITHTRIIKDFGVFFELKLYFHNHVDYKFLDCIKILRLIRYIRFRCSSLYYLCVLYVSRIKVRICLSSLELYHVY
jgi:hypothetical protein